MKIVKPKDEEIEAVLARAEEMSKQTFSASEQAMFEAWFGKPLFVPGTPHYNGADARKAWEAWQMRASLTGQSASYAIGVKATVKWMIEGGRPPLGAE